MFEWWVPQFTFSIKNFHSAINFEVGLELMYILHFIMSDQDM